LATCEVGPRCSENCFPSLFLDTDSNFEPSVIELKHVLDRPNYVYAPVGGECSVLFEGSHSGEPVRVHVFVFDPSLMEPPCQGLSRLLRRDNRLIGQYNVCPIGCALAIKGYVFNTWTHVLWIVEEWGERLDYDDMFLQTQLQQDVVCKLVEKSNHLLRSSNPPGTRSQDGVIVLEATRDPVADMCVDGTRIGIKHGRDDDVCDDEPSTVAPFSVKDLWFDKLFDHRGFAFRQHLFLNACPLSLCFNPYPFVPEIQRVWRLNPGSASQRFSFRFNLDSFLEALFSDKPHLQVGLREAIKKFFVCECGCEKYLEFGDFLQSIERFGFWYDDPRPFTEAWCYYHPNDIAKWGAAKGVRQFYFRAGKNNPASVTAKFYPDMEFHGMKINSASIIFDYTSKSFFIPPFGVFRSTHQECLEALNKLCDNYLELEGIKPDKSLRTKYINK